ncbi:hypothetical protein Emag_005692 [Eimeria magna]
MDSKGFDGRPAPEEEDASFTGEKVEDAAVHDEVNKAEADRNSYRFLDFEVRRQGKKSVLHFRATLAALLFAVFFFSLGAAARLALHQKSERGSPVPTTPTKTLGQELLPKTGAAPEHPAPSEETVPASDDAPPPPAAPVPPTDVAPSPPDVASQPADVAPQPPDVVPQRAVIVPRPPDVAPPSADVAPSPAGVAPPPSGVAPQSAVVAPSLAGVAPQAPDVMHRPPDVAPHPADMAPPPPDVAPQPAGVAPPPADVEPLPADVAPPLADGAAPAVDVVGPPADGVARPADDAPRSELLAPQEAGQDEAAKLAEGEQRKETPVRRDSGDGSSEDESFVLAEEGEWPGDRTKPDKPKEEISAEQVPPKVAPEATVRLIDSLIESKFAPLRRPDGLIIKETIGAGGDVQEVAGGLLLLKAQLQDFAPGAMLDASVLHAYSMLVQDVIDQVHSAHKVVFALPVPLWDILENDYTPHNAHFIVAVVDRE